MLELKRCVGAGKVCWGWKGMLGLERCVVAYLSSYFHSSFFILIACGYLLSNSYFCLVNNLAT